MKYHRNMFLTLLLLCMLFLYGCSQEQKETGTAKQKTKISIMMSGYDSENNFGERLKEYIKEKRNDVELEVSVLPDDQYYASLKLMLASGEGPDIIAVQAKYGGENSVYQLAGAGYLEPMSDLKGKVVESDAVKKGLSLNGVPYALGHGSFFVLGTFYNKTIFEECGLQVPDDWEDFLNCCEVLKRKGYTPITMGDKECYVTQFGLYQLAANVIYPENPYYDRKLWTGESKFTDEGTWDQVISMYESLYDKEYMDPDSIKMGYQTAVRKFEKGGAAMTFGGYNILYSIDEGQRENFGYFPLPGNKKGDPVRVIVTTEKGGYAVNANSKNKELCKELLNSYFEELQESSSHIDELSCYYEAVENGYAVDVCNSNWPSGTENELEQLFIQLIGSDTLNVEDVTEGTQTRLEELIERYGDVKKETYSD